MSSHCHWFCWWSRPPCVRSLLALRNVDLDSTRAGCSPCSSRCPSARYPTPAQVDAFFDTALQRIRTFPGSRPHAGLTTCRYRAARCSDRPRRAGELLPHEHQPWMSGRSAPGTSRRWAFQCSAGAMPPPATRNFCWSSRPPRSCSGGRGPGGRRVTLPLQSRMVRRPCRHRRRGREAGGRSPRLWHRPATSIRARWTVVERTVDRHAHGAAAGDAANAASGVIRASTTAGE